MMRRALLGFLLTLVLGAGPRWAAAIEAQGQLINQQFAQGLDDFARELREWFGRWGDYFGSGTMKSEERPLIAFILRNREKLDLSATQVKNLEQLVVADKVDMAMVEAKVRVIDRLRGDLRIARIRTIQKGKEVLTADQRKKLQELLAEQIAGLQSRSVL